MLMAPVDGNKWRMGSACSSLFHVSYARAGTTQRSLIDANNTNVVSFASALAAKNEKFENKPSPSHFQVGPEGRFLNERAMSKQVGAMR